MNITRQDALDFLNSNIYYAEILEHGEELFKIKVEDISDFLDIQLAQLCEDFGYNEDAEIEISII